MTGPEALAAFNQASDLVKEGKYLEAICVDLFESDIIVIVKKIRKAINGASANTTKENT